VGTFADQVVERVRPVAGDDQLVHLFDDA